jgi:L-lactate dehydrogenase (cytochrome)
MSDSKISVSEIDKHAAADDCWIVVNGKVYDLTTFAPEHPGGPDSKSPTPTIKT